MCIKLSFQVVAKPKGVHTAADKPRQSYKLSKLPPRFAKQREQLRGEKSKNPPGSAGLEEGMQVSTFMPKIENWDNELANNIPPLMSQVINTEVKQQDIDLSKSKRPISVPFSSIVSLKRCCLVVLYLLPKLNFRYFVMCSFLKLVDKNSSLQYLSQFLCRLKRRHRDYLRRPWRPDFLCSVRRHICFNETCLVSLSIIFIVHFQFMVLNELEVCCSIYNVCFLEPIDLRCEKKDVYSTYLTLKAKNYIKKIYIDSNRIHVLMYIFITSLQNFPLYKKYFRYLQQRIEQSSICLNMFYSCSFLFVYLYITDMGMGGYSPVVGQTTLQNLTQMAQQQSQPSQSQPSLAPAPVPSVNAWNKPINFASVTSMQVQVQVCIFTYIHI